MAVLSLTLIFLTAFEVFRYFILHQRDAGYYGYSDRIGNGSASKADFQILCNF